MPPEDVSPEIRALYSEMYGDGQRVDGANLGAIDKSANILRAWSSLSAQPPRVVEIGCGEGAIASALAERGFFMSYIGFDLSPSGVAEATAREITSATFTAVEASNIPLSSDSADLVILSHVVEHLEHPRQLLHEARRLAPVVIVEVPLELNAGAPRDYVLDSLGHINKYNAMAIRHLVQSCGFEVLDQFTTNPSKALRTFHQDNWKTRTRWATKQTALKVWPGAARALFTYHETLLLRRG